MQSKHVNHFKFNSEHNKWYLYDHPMNMKSLIWFLFLRYFHMSSKIYEENGYKHVMDVALRGVSVLKK